jgi:putative ABC transport system ATP-binding protein
MKPLIEIKNIHKVYHTGHHQVRALNGLNLQIKQGEFVAIIGQSGSGKSTLMNMLGCLDTPTSGEYFLDGKDVSNMTENELADVRNQTIGFIFQSFNLIPSLDALSNVALPLIYRGVSESKRLNLASRALGLVGLQERANHKPAEMSGGQQQRVAVARAIATRPPIILADEPTGNLDSGSTKEVMRILKSLSKMGRTVIIITHDLEIAKQAKRVIRIRDGQIERDEFNDEFSEGDV